MGSHVRTEVHGEGGPLLALCYFLNWICIYLILYTFCIFDIFHKFGGLNSVPLFISLFILGTSD